MYLLALILGLILPAHLPILLDRQIALAFILLVIGFFFVTQAAVKLQSLTLTPIAILRVTRVLCIFLSGYCMTSIQLGSAIDRQIPTNIEGIDISIDAEVVGLPSVKPPNGTNRNVRFDARILVAHYSGRKYEGKKIDIDGLKGKQVRLSWRQNKSEPHVRAGQYWRFFVRLKRPRGLANPGGFDYQAWLIQQGMSATGYVRTQNNNALLAERSESFFDSLRQALDQQLFSYKSSEMIGVMRALIIGDKSRISASQWDVLAKTGTAHLMAISGLHIGLVATFTFVFVRKLLPVVIVSNTRISILRAAPAIASIVASSIYAGVADFAIPTQRALTIVVLLNVSYITGRRPGIMCLILYAAACVLLINPFASLQNGFWLSFGAVSCLIFCFANRSPKIGNVKAIFVAQLIVFVGLAALLAIRQLPISLLSPLANLIAVPVVSFLVIPSLFMSALLIKTW